MIVYIEIYAYFADYTIDLGIDFALKEFCL